MKTIDTLIEDINKVFRDFHDFDEARVSSFGRDISLTTTSRINETKRSATLRASNLGTPCERKLWYNVNQPEQGDTLPVNARIKFLFGDYLEHFLLFLAEEAGHDVSFRQHEINVEGIVGHIDAVIDGVLVDCKSASSYSYQKFAKHQLADNDPFGYIDQLNFYHYGARYSGLPVDPNRFAFFAIDKQLGHICLDFHQPNGVDYKKVVNHKKEVVNGPIPKRGYFDVPDGKSGNRKLDTYCGYCEYKHACWPNLRTFLYAGGPRYLTNVEKLPDVPEARGKVEEEQVE